MYFTSDGERKHFTSVPLIGHVVLIYERIDNRDELAATKAARVTTVTTRTATKPTATSVTAAAATALAVVEAASECEEEGDTK